MDDIVWNWLNCRKFGLVVEVANVEALFPLVMLYLGLIMGAGAVVVGSCLFWLPTPPANRLI